MRLEAAFAYLQCTLDVQLELEEIELEYTPETAEEAQEITVLNVRRGRAKRQSLLHYDLLTRAVFAAEDAAGPGLEATLFSAARSAAQAERYIDSFRYSFLLIEATYGNGKYQSVQLKAALKNNPDFTTIVATTLREHAPPTQPQNSDTEKLLSSRPSTTKVIDHIVDKRGFYIHGNAKRKDAWKPDDQASAEALCRFALAITLLIAQAAARPMFRDELSKRHFDVAKGVGANMTLKVDFQLEEPGDKLHRNESMTFTLPGTTVTPRMAQHVAQQFLARFERGAPIATLKWASCTVEKSGQKVFDMQFYASNS